MERCYIETTCLLIKERCVHEHWVCTFHKKILQLLLSNHKTEFLTLIANHGIHYELLPYLVLNLVEFFIREILTLLHDLHHFLLLLNKIIKLLHRDFLTKHLAYLLTLLIARSLTRTEELFGNEGKKSQTYHYYECGAPASDFSYCCHLDFKVLII